ncbi:phosphonate transport system substrate-binding protein [Andreprevotia lacus DSM 23236]|jgi:phosphonate transport system substrate-binding protein|uniref:Phosphonate transport system substrate-binding protein n=1 Tax=Andreprevotia lacus DSM 23236 TaxID=1121001 RepID=A0A1W1WX81_9NEIS|nr:phosphate/phosphite/phosphonate ABC transporter substrate-binding protein [Andreprevotia lacus]SMC16028.1 phosphonate transport system substrate-binding protein [Andreprevotia lacus DSM 23236]
MLRRLLCTLLLVLPLASHAAELTVGLIATRNPEELLGFWQPVIDDLSASIGQPVKVIAVKNYDELQQKFHNNEVQVARVGNRLALSMVEHDNAEVFARLVQNPGRAEYNSILLVRKDSGINNLDSLLRAKGRYRFASDYTNSTAGYLIPQYHAFLKNNILPEQLFKSMRQGNYEDNFMALYRKEVDVAVANSFDIEQLQEKYPREFGAMKVIWTSPNFAFDPLVYKSTLPAALKVKISAFFTKYGREGNNATQQKQKLYYADQLDGFLPASNRLLRETSDLQLYNDLFRLTLNASVPANEKTAQEKDYYRRYQQLVGILGGAR